MRKVALVVVCGVLLLPTYLMLKGSLESTVGLMTMPPALVPRGVTLFHYVRVITAPYFVRWVVNSVALCASAIVGSCVVTLMAGYAFQLKWPGQKLVLATLLLSAVLPVMVLIIPRYLMMRMAGVTGGYGAALVPLVYSPTGILICRAWMMQIGPTHCEEARLEGANDWQVLWHIAVPMTTPVIALGVIGQGIMALGDFLWQTMTLPMEHQQTLMVGLNNFVTNRVGPGYPDPLGLQMAIGVVMLIPMVVVFLVGQRFFVGEGKGLIV